MRFITVDISDENNPLWNIYRINVVPTVIVFRNGDIVYRFEGKLGKTHIKKMIKVVERLK